ncbi:amino acid adenylation domain-containing protein [Streptomyces goshikiensis]|uniref:amino acid adenylation domain-containing protein n=1 Tax=Streptomyces goshikiensis TaxID=1942 RepID=UPI0036DF2CE6
MVMNRTATHGAAAPSPSVIHELFARWARLTPHAPALVHGSTTVTYRELDALAEDFAAELAEAGVGPGDLVPVMMPRSIRLVVAFLGILKRGAAYAALDPTWPQGRLARLVGVLGSAVAVCDAPLAFDVRRVCPVRPEEFAAVAAAPRATTPVPVAEDAPACVIFTSGSTGEPKGALSPHAGTVRLFQDCPFADLGPTTVMPLAAAVPWDALSLELWSVLINGGCSVVVEEPYLLPATLRDMVTRHGVNAVFLTSALFHLFVDEDLDALAGIGHLLVGGERVSPRHLAAFVDAHPEAAALHCYGPVEATIFTTVHRVRPEDCAHPEGVPLGSPVPRTGVYIWNGQRECGPDEVGELLVSGAGLALGYLGDEERTARSFPVLELAGQPVRVYRTGDLVHRTPDGRLHFDGRADRQVKIRGQRIEPAEVEQAAGLLPGVRRCAAVAVPDGSGGYRELVLAFTVTEGVATDEAQVLAALRERLPRHLVPQRTVQLETLPLTGNGKLDAAALLKAAADARSQPPAVDAGQPSEGLERTIAETMAQVLKLPRVSPTAAFFDLGGTSLQLGVLCTRLADETGTPVPISEVVRRPSARVLAQWLEPRLALGGAAATGPGTDGADAAAPGPVRLSTVQTSYWTQQRLRPEDLSALCPLAWEVQGPVDTAALDLALGDLTDRHEALRAQYRLDPTARPARLAAFPVTAADRAPSGPELVLPATRASRSEALQALRAALLAPLDPERGALWRAAVVPVAGGGTCLLGLVVHHIAFDGHSTSVLAEELAACYAARAAGRAPEFAQPAPTLREVDDRLARIRDLADGERQRAFWQSTLRGLPELEFPRPAPAVAPTSVERSPASCREISVTLDGREIAMVAELARARGTTPFVVLLSGWAAALRSVTGQVDFGVGVPVARRADPLLGRAVGCLVDSICLRLSGDAGDWDDLVAATARVTTEGLAAQDVPLGEVIRLVNPPRTGRAPLYQTIFAYQDAPHPQLSLTGCTVTPLRIAAAEGVAELVLEVWPQPDGTVRADLTFQEAVVDGEFAVKLLAAFLRVLGSAVRRPGPAPLSHGLG